jgi:hypothetical protein
MNLAIRGLARRLLAWKNKNEKKSKKYLDNSRGIDYIKNMKQELVERYYDYYDRLKKGELTIQQWNDLCLLLLQEIMEENKDVFIRLKNR